MVGNCLQKWVPPSGGSKKIAQTYIMWVLWTCVTRCWVQGYLSIFIKYHWAEKTSKTWWNHLIFKKVNYLAYFGRFLSPGSLDKKYKITLLSISWHKCRVPTWYSFEQICFLPFRGWSLFFFLPPSGRYLLFLRLPPTTLPNQLGPLWNFKINLLYYKTIIPTCLFTIWCDYHMS